MAPSVNLETLLTAVVNLSGAIFEKCLTAAGFRGKIKSRKTVKTSLAKALWLCYTPDKLNENLTRDVRR
jgi:hypothetical protein